MKTTIVFNAGPLHNQSAGIHVWTKEMLIALHRLQEQGQMPKNFHWILLTEKPTQDFPLFEVKTLPVYRFIPGYAAWRLFFILPFLAIKSRANYFIEPGHFGPFNLPSKIKRLTVIHDLTPILFPQWHQNFSAKAQQLFFPRIFKKTDQIIAVSQNTQSDLEKIYPVTEGKIKVIYPGISNQFSPDSQIEKKPFLLFVGTIEPRKNLESLIQAFDELKRTPNFEHFQLIIAGKRGWKTDEFDFAIQRSPNQKDIILEGYVSEKRKIELYRTCSVFIYPSHYEGFGFPILEALACGATVVCSENGSLKEIGNKYVLFMGKNDLADKIQRAMESRSSGIEYAQSFTWEKSAKGVIKLLGQL
jgi:glycosyltransferase involved in cell wall biosynthesis